MRRKNLFACHERVGQARLVATEDAHVSGADDRVVGETFLRPIHERLDVRHRCSRIATQLLGKSWQPLSQEHRVPEHKRESRGRPHWGPIVCIRRQRRVALCEVRLHAIQDHRAKRLLKPWLPLATRACCRALQLRHFHR